MIELKLVSIGLSGILFALGGGGFLFCRRYIMPVVIAVMASLATGVWWAGVMVLPVMGTLCIGYSGGKWLKRGLWLGLQAFVIGLGLFLTHHIGWYFYAPYVAIAAILGGTLYLLEQMIGDCIFGCWLGVILILLH